MGSNYHSTSTSGVPRSRANKKATSKANPPLPPSVSASGSSLGPGRHAPPGPAPPHTQHDRAIVNNGSKTPPPPCAESRQGIIGCDSKASLASPSFRNSNSLHPASPKEPSSRQVYDPHVVDDSAVRDVVSLIPRTFPFRCSTTAHVSELNCHLDGNYVGLWKPSRKPSRKPIPISINLESFKPLSPEHGQMVKRCLARVLDSLNSQIIGIQFRIVDNPSDSAFYISYGGEYRGRYAESFFPSSHPKDWQIYVYNLGLSLTKKQDRLIRDVIEATIPSKDARATATAAARWKILEQNLEAILSHEMLHIMGLRHCDAQQTEEEEPCAKYPNHISPKDHHDLLMQTNLHWSDFPGLTWNPETMKHIRELYAKHGDKGPDAKKDDGKILGYEIKYFSWEDGVERRDELLRQHAKCRHVGKSRKAK